VLRSNQTLNPLELSSFGSSSARERRDVRSQAAGAAIKTPRVILRVRVRVRVDAAMKTPDASAPACAANKAL